MDILITNVASNSIGTYYTMTCDKQTMEIAAYHSGSWAGQVSCQVQNASRRAFRRLGRNFSSWDEALAAYKSASCKAMIQYARDAETARMVGTAGETVAA